jgi:undecaprenol kinase/diacylglycerol kinase (ATP)
MKAFLNRVRYPLQGWVSFFRHEKNGQIQLLIAVFVVIAGFLLSISVIEWMMVLACIGVVIALEMINSAIEKFCDHVNPQVHPTIKFVKDIAAGAVLWVAVISAIIGAIIFLPKIFSYLL